MLRTHDVVLAEGTFHGAAGVHGAAWRRARDQERHRARARRAHGGAEYQRDLRRIEAANRQRRREAPAAARVERRSESDDEVRGNIPADLVPLFERVRRSIKASPRMSRTEAFLRYAEENPEEVLLTIEDRTEAMIRELEREQAAARRRLAPPSKRPRYTREVLSAVPF